MNTNDLIKYSTVEYLTLGSDDDFVFVKDVKDINLQMGDQFIYLNSINDIAPKVIVNDIHNIKLVRQTIKLITDGVDKDTISLIEKYIKINHKQIDIIK